MVGESTFRKYVWVAVICFIAVTVYLGFKVTNVEFDYDFEKFFPSHDQETDFFQEFRTHFKSENDYLLVAIERDQGVFDKKFLQEVDEIARKIKKVKNVEFVQSITDQEEVFLFKNGFTSSKKYIDFEHFDAEDSRRRVMKNEELLNNLVAKNGKSLLIYVKHKDYLAKEKCDQLIIDVKAIVDQYKFDSVHMAGRSVQQKYYIDKMMVELGFFVGMSAVLIIIFLLIAFRSIWGVLLPQVIIGGSMVWLVGGMGLFGAKINILLTVLPTIMFIVAMSDVIHLTSRYLDALRAGEKPFDGIMTAIHEVGVATLLTSVTTAIGFFSLYFVQIEPIQMFGLVMGIGVIIAFVLTFLMLPVMFYLFPGPKHIRHKKKAHFWGAFLHAGFNFILRRWKPIFIVTGVVVALSVVGLLQIKADNYLLDDLRDSEPLKQDFNYFDKKYGGVRPFELVVTVTDTSKQVWDKDIIQTLDTVENYLTAEYGVSIKFSLPTAYKVLNRSSHAGNTDYYKLPDRSSAYRSFRRNLKMANEGEMVKSLVDSTQHITHISGMLPDVGNQEVSARNEKLKTFLKNKTLNGAINYQLTGTAHLVDKNLHYLSYSLIRGLGVSILIVALLIGIIYRSGTILVVSVIANIIPLIVIAGIMGFFGIELKTSTAIIYTIAFGIAVDDTIHFLGKFKHELMRGKSKLYALKRSYLTTGKAMILTTLILCAGFLLLMFSSFLGTFYMGILLCVTLLIALIADITLLPLMLLLFYKPKPKKKA